MVSVVARVDKHNVWISPYLVGRKVADKCGLLWFGTTVQFIHYGDFSRATLAIESVV